MSIITIQVHSLWSHQLKTVPQTMRVNDNLKNLPSDHGKSQGVHDFIHWIDVLNSIRCFEDVRSLEMVAMDVGINWLLVNLPVLGWKQWQTVWSRMHPLLSNVGTICMHGMVKATEIWLTWAPWIVWQKRESTAKFKIGTCNKRNHTLMNLSPYNVHILASRLEWPNTFWTGHFRL